MGRPAVDSSNSHLASGRGASRSSSGVEVVSGKGGSTVFRVGSDFSQPVEAPNEDQAGAAELIAELHRQKRARQSN
ncbi:MAG: hypothetical protein IIA10_04365 [Proteobacteria bacterium]|nr:hypothetical protein [Pseudomonadota bacterium]